MSFDFEKRISCADNWIVQMLGKHVWIAGMSLSSCLIIWPWLDNVDGSYNLVQISRVSSCLGTLVLIARVSSCLRSRLQIIVLGG